MLQCTAMRNACKQQKVPLNATYACLHARQLKEAALSERQDCKSGEICYQNNAKQGNH